MTIHNKWSTPQQGLRIIASHQVHESKSTMPIAISIHHENSFFDVGLRIILRPESSETCQVKQEGKKSDAVVYGSSGHAER
jgi:hypothetical protein